MKKKNLKSIPAKAMSDTVFLYSTSSIQWHIPIVNTVAQKILNIRLSNKQFSNKASNNL